MYCDRFGEKYRECLCVCVSVCLSVCLSVQRLLAKLLGRFWWNFPKKVSPRCRGSRFNFELFHENLTSWRPFWKTGKFWKNVKTYEIQNLKLNFIVLRRHLLSKCRVKNDFFHFFQNGRQSRDESNFIYFCPSRARITKLISTKSSTNSLLSTKLCVSEFWAIWLIRWRHGGHIVEKTMALSRPQLGSDFFKNLNRKSLAKN